MDEYKNTELILAVKEKNFLKVKQLVELNININESNIWGNTPLIYAAYSGNYEITKYLIYCGAKVNQENDSERTAIFYVNDIKLFKLLIYYNGDIESYNIFNLEISDFVRNYNYNRDIILKDIRDELIIRRESELYIYIILLIEGYFKLKDYYNKFLTITSKLPYELIAIICNRTYRKRKDTIFLLFHPMNEKYMI